MGIKESENVYDASTWIMAWLDFENCFWEDKRLLPLENYSFKKNGSNNPEDIIYWNEGGGVGLFCGEQLVARAFSVVGECGELLARLVFYPPYSLDLKIIEHLKKCHAVRE